MSVSFLFGSIIGILLVFGIFVMGNIVGFVSGFFTKLLLRCPECGKKAK